MGGGIRYIAKPSSHYSFAVGLGLKGKNAVLKQNEK